MHVKCNILSLLKRNLCGGGKNIPCDSGLHCCFCCYCCVRLKVLSDHHGTRCLCIATIVNHIFHGVNRFVLFTGNYHPVIEKKVGILTTGASTI